MSHSLLNYAEHIISSHRLTPTIISLLRLWDHFVLAGYLFIYVSTYVLKLTFAGRFYFSYIIGTTSKSLTHRGCAFDCDMVIFGA